MNPRLPSIVHIPPLLHFYHFDRELEHLLGRTVPLFDLCESLHATPHRQVLS